MNIIFCVYLRTGVLVGKSGCATVLAYFLTESEMFLRVVPCDILTSECDLCQIWFARL